MVEPSNESKVSRQRLLAEVAAVGLPVGDWALFGSGPLLLRGWLEHVSDVDIISRGAAWEMARTVGREEPLGDGNSIMAIGDVVTVGTSWAYGDLDINHLIDTSEMVSGVPCVRLEHIVAYKRIAGRPRDREHLVIIESHT